jgi:hypothetical protein
MFDPDAGMPRLNRSLVYLGACLIAGIRLARKADTEGHGKTRHEPDTFKLRGR